MSFAGKVWRFLVGVKDALALLFLLLFFTMLFAVLGTRPNPGLVRDGALLLELQGSVVEEPAAVDPLAVLLSGTLPSRQYRARDITRAIDEAARDDRITALALDLSTFTGGGQVHMQEVGNALARFRAADKPIIAYAIAYSDDALMLAAHASEVWIDPMGGAAIQGPGGYRQYYASALDRFGINARVYRVGTYKSAVEPYLENAMSPAARENAEGYISALWEEFRAHVMQARPELDFDSIANDPVALIAQNGGNLANAALAAGVADSLGTHQQWGERVAEIVGEDDWSRLPGSFAHTQLDPWLAEIGGEGSNSGFGSNDATIGVITIAGQISDGNAGPGQAGAARITDLLDAALSDDLAALVVRVDSPGGTVTGSEAIRRAILRHKDTDIPIAISMGNYAASGGYWVATAGDRIFAEPETLTGSIGVFSVIPTFENVLSEYGIASDGVQTTPLSGQPDLLAGLSPETDALLQAEVEAIYSQFTALVSESRGISVERADELGQGRVWTGGMARQLGLVDQFGDLDAAIAWAASAADLAEDDWNVRFLVGTADPFDAALAGIFTADQSPQTLVTLSDHLVARDSAISARIIGDLDRLMSMHGVQALCLECAAAPASSAQGLQQSWWHSIAGQLLER